MKSDLKFYNKKDNNLSNCGDSLDISLSSKQLNWNGVIFEKGSSPTFYPENVYTPYFYFALAMEEDLSWQAKMDGEMQILKSTPGNIWINPPKTPFSHKIYEVCYFHILAIEEEKFLNFVDNRLDRDKLKFLNNYNVDDPTLHSIMDLFYKEVINGGKNGEPYIESLINLIATHYINNYSNAEDLRNQSLNSSKISDSEIQAVKEYISKNFENQIQIEDLAKLLNYSKFHFLREFKKSTGLTPYQFILDFKLSKAKDLLTDLDNNIAYVTYRLGFSDQSYFTRVFKNRYGVTPGQFQKQLK